MLERHVRRGGQSSQSCCGWLTRVVQAAAAAQRLAEERETRLQRNGGTMRNRAAEIEAEKAAEAVLANLP